MHEPDDPVTVQVLVASSTERTTYELGVPAIEVPAVTDTDTAPSCAVAIGTTGVAGGNCMETMAPSVLLTAAIRLRVAPPIVVNAPPR